MNIRDFGHGLRATKNNFIAPTPADIERLASKAERIYVVLNQSYPSKSAIDDAPKAADLFTDIDDELTRFIDGLMSIEKGLLRHKRLFKRAGSSRCLPPGWQRCR